MANTRPYFRSFSGGEISPEMHGRIDDAKYQSGAARLRNFVATPQGPAENRAGFEYVIHTKNDAPARLIPFTYSSDQTMIVEVGAGYFRFHTFGATLLNDAGQPYEVANPYASADLFAIHYGQSADVMTLVHPNYPPAELQRHGALDWRFKTLAVAPSVTPPTGVTCIPSPGLKIPITSMDGATITTSVNHTLVVGDAVYISGITVGGVSKNGFYIVNDVPVDTGGKPIPTKLTVVDYDGNPLNGATLSGASIQYGGRVYDVENRYVVTCVSADGLDESAISSEVAAMNNLNVSGSFNTISWSGAASAGTSGWQANRSYNFGDSIKDANGNLQQAAQMHPAGVAGVEVIGGSVPTASIVSLRVLTGEMRITLSAASPYPDGASVTFACDYAPLNGRTATVTNVGDRVISIPW